jgi:IS5 family transposase
MKVYISGQKRSPIDAAIKRDWGRRSAVELVIGHAKAEHRMDCARSPRGVEGDAANAVLAAAGYNFGRLLTWLAALLRVFVMAAAAATQDIPIPALHDA